MNKKLSVKKAATKVKAITEKHVELHNKTKTEQIKQDVVKVNGRTYEEETEEEENVPTVGDDIDVNTDNDDDVIDSSDDEDDGAIIQSKKLPKKRKLIVISDSNDTESLEISGPTLSGVSSFFNPETKEESESSSDDEENVSCS